MNGKEKTGQARGLTRHQCSVLSQRNDRYPIDAQSSLLRTHPRGRGLVIGRVRREGDMRRGWGVRCAPMGAGWSSWASWSFKESPVRDGGYMRSVLRERMRRDIRAAMADGEGYDVRRGELLGRVMDGRERQEGSGGAAGTSEGALLARLVKARVAVLADHHSPSPELYTLRRPRLPRAAILDRYPPFRCFRSQNGKKIIFPTYVSSSFLPPFSSPSTPPPSSDVRNIFPPPRSFLPGPASHPSLFFLSPTRLSISSSFCVLHPIHPS